MPNIHQFVLTIFGLGVEINVSYMNSPFSWYVFFYIIMVIYISYFVDVIDKKNLGRGIFVSGTLFLLLGFMKFFGGDQLFRPTTYISYLMVAMSGVLCAKFRVINQLKNKYKSGELSSFVGIFFLILFTTIILIVRYLIPVFTDWILAPLYIAMLVKIVERIKISNPQRLKNVANFLAKYSTAMWFLQAIFFTPNRSVQRIAYWSNIGCVVFVWSYILLLVASIVCMWICDHINRKLFS